MKYICVVCVIIYMFCYLFYYVTGLLFHFLKVLFALYIHLWCWGSNAGPCVCQASTLSLNYTLAHFFIFKKARLKAIFFSNYL